MKLFHPIALTAALLLCAGQASAADVYIGLHEHYGPGYRSVDSRTVTVTTIYRERVIVHNSRPRYAPFAGHRYERPPVRRYDHHYDRHYDRYAPRHDSRSRHSPKERGRRNHYK